ncbi:hypothetical protein BKA57DRAFT_466421 [Linnemannia elongata]|nr:hypothetical protein BKA57DRAFT_466421 [Linnemannia elongata]
MPTNGNPLPSNPPLTPTAPTSISSPTTTTTTTLHTSRLTSPSIKDHVFDIPELLIPILSSLILPSSSHNLLPCLTVSRQFHSLAIPILYNSISILTDWQFHVFLSAPAQRALRKYACHVRSFETRYYGLLRCFLREEVDCRNLGRLAFLKGCRADPPVPSGFPVPDPDDFDYDDATVTSTQEICSSSWTGTAGGSNWMTESRARNVLGLVDEELLMRVMAKSPRLSVFVMIGFPFDHDQLIRRIADRISYGGEGGVSEFKKLELVNPHYGRARVRSIEYLLNRCPPGLEELLLSISFGSRAELDSEGDFQDDQLPKQEQGQEQEQEQDEQDEHEQMEGTWKLRKLSIGGDLGGPGGLIWLPLLRRCGQLQNLSAHLFTDDSLGKLSSVLRSSCPNLNELTLQCMTGGSQADEQIAMLIQSSGAWKNLSLSFFHGFGPLTTAALIHQHSTTLETLVLKECDGFCSEDIQTVLSSCVNLRTFQAMTSSGTEFSSTVYLDASEMVDSPWVCLGLENLKLVITGIARPDLKKDQYGRRLTGPLHDGTIQGYEMQQIVYSQLGKLTRLQELWLGHDIPDLDDEENYHPTEVDGQWRYIDPDEQFECLEFSLRSGLDLLGGLTELRVLNMDRMNIRVGLSEVQWMASKWPKLEKIVGLVVQGDVAPKYVQWLYDHRPDIELPPVLGNFTTAFSSRLM